MNGKKARALRKILGIVPHKKSAARSAYKAAKRHHDNGQHPKFAEPRALKQKAAVTPSWPKTLDQKRQSRPLIVLHPVRQMCAGKSERRKAEIRRAFNNIPKFALDEAAIHGHPALW